MFTGIIEEIGIVKAIRKNKNSAEIEISAKTVLDGIRPGDSIALNGICLTAKQHSTRTFMADVMHETMERSSIRQLKSGSCVNLERAMRADGRFGGHLVTGHIDGMGVVKKVQKDENAVWYTIGANSRLMCYIIEKGSVAIDGTSLTVAKVLPEGFLVSIIPHTMSNTILAGMKPGDTVNLENDCVGKYIGHFLGLEEQTDQISREFLLKHGF